MWHHPICDWLFPRGSSHWCSNSNFNLPRVRNIPPWIEGNNCTYSELRERNQDFFWCTIAIYSRISPAGLDKTPVSDRKFLSVPECLGRSAGLKAFRLRARQTNDDYACRVENNLNPSCSVRTFNWVTGPLRALWDTKGLAHRAPNGYFFKLIYSEWRELEFARAGFSREPLTADTLPGTPKRSHHLHAKLAMASARAW